MSLNQLIQSTNSIHLQFEKFSGISLTCARFDVQSKYTFLGDYSGQIYVLKVSDNEVKVITVLKGHSGMSSTSEYVNLNNLIKSDYFVAVADF